MAITATDAEGNRISAGDLLLSSDGRVYRVISQPYPSVTHLNCDELRWRKRQQAWVVVTGKRKDLVRPFSALLVSDLDGLTDKVMAASAYRERYRSGPAAAKNREEFRSRQRRMEDLRQRIDEIR